MSISSAVSTTSPHGPSQTEPCPKELISAFGSLSVAERLKLCVSYWDDGRCLKAPAETVVIVDVLRRYDSSCLFDSELYPNLP